MHFTTPNISVIWWFMEKNKEYPISQIEFEDWFRSEAQCLAYLQKLRWPEGFRCPDCGHRRTEADNTTINIQVDEPMNPAATGGFATRQSVRVGKMAQFSDHKSSTPQYAFHPQRLWPL